MKIIKAIVRTDGSCLNHKKLFTMITNGYIIDTRTEKGSKTLNHLKELGFKFSISPLPVPYIQIVEWQDDKKPVPEPVQELAEPAVELAENDEVSFQEEKIRAPRKRKSQ